LPRLDRFEGWHTGDKTVAAREWFLKWMTEEDVTMSIRRKSAEQEVKGLGQKAKGIGQEIVGRATGDDDMRARGELNQVGGTVRSRAGEVGRKISGAVSREKTKRR
jgi:uncharacterized protein YjbJ (UPF0337 family)